MDVTRIYLFGYEMYFICRLCPVAARSTISKPHPSGAYLVYTCGRCFPVGTGDHREYLRWIP